MTDTPTPARPALDAMAEEIERLHKAAKPEPWRVDSAGYVWMTEDDYLSFDTKALEPRTGWPESEIIAYLRNNAPTLVAALRSLADMRENQQTIRNALDFASKGAGVLAAMTKGAKLMLGHKAALDLSEQIELAKEALARSAP